MLKFGLTRGYVAQRGERESEREDLKSSALIYACHRRSSVSFSLAAVLCHVKPMVRFSGGSGDVKPGPRRTIGQCENESSGDNPICAGPSLRWEDSCGHR